MDFINDLTPMAYQRLVDDKFIIVAKETGEILDYGENEKGYATAEEALQAYSQKCQKN